MIFAEEAIPFDGELYDHGRSFDGKEGIHSICSRRANPHPLASKIQFHIFDIQWETKSQWFRFQKLKEYEKDFNNSLCLVQTEIIQTEEWLNLMKDYVEFGYEGIILRNPISLYRPKRDVGLIKVKPTEPDEYKIVEAYEAISLEGIPKGMVGGFTVIDKEGVIFNVGAGKIKHNKRIQLWKNRHDLPGKILETKHEPTKTKGGVPECAVAVRVKE